MPVSAVFEPLRSRGCFGVSILSAEERGLGMSYCWVEMSGFYKSSFFGGRSRGGGRIGVKRAFGERGLERDLSDYCSP
jgi:hypothetical protein